MSDIERKPIELPAGVTVSLSGNEVRIKGSGGELVQWVDPLITLNHVDNTLRLACPSTQKDHKALYGLYYALIRNMIIGVTEGYQKTLELVGVGYKASTNNNVLELNLGYAHSILFAMPIEVQVNAEMAKGKNPMIHLKSIDKQLLGQVAAKIRSLRKVEPYKGKGIRFLGELVRRKAGKTTTK